MKTIYKNLLNSSYFLFF